jgi:hypothetical protein
MGMRAQVTRLRSSIVLLLSVVLAAPVFMTVSTANHEPQIACLLPLDPTCPDLTVDSNRFNAYTENVNIGSTSCEVVEGHTQAGARTLLRFTFTTPNQGLTDLVVGPPQGNPNFVFSSCHGHYHFIQYADYRLWTPSQHTAYEALRIANPGVQAHEILEAHPELTPAKGDKRGFCVIDLVQYDITSPIPRWQSCSNQGITPGWADEYYHRLSGQYVDVTGLPSGSYVLEAEVNSEHLYNEANYDNNRAYRTVNI